MGGKPMPNNLDEAKQINITMPAYLIDLFNAQAEYNGRSFNEELIAVLEKAIFIPPETLGMFKDIAEAKAELDAIREASEEEGQMLLAKIRERNRVIADLSILNPTKH
jgi:hypothetical protein